MWFIGVEVEQETSAPPPEKNPGSAPALASVPLKKPIKKRAFWKEQFYWNEQTSKTLDILVVFSTMFTFK